MRLYLIKRDFSPDTISLINSKELVFAHHRIIHLFQENNPIPLLTQLRACLYGKPAVPGSTTLKYAALLQVDFLLNWMGVDIVTVEFI